MTLIPIESQVTTRLVHPEWISKAVLYEVNIRQYTQEGTFNAFVKHLPRLKKLGVTVLWLMPIHPIGQKNRKGTMGSPYAVQDYLQVNPEYGTMENFKSLVKQCHEMGIKVIIDWVANHTAWDNVLLKDQEDWFLKNERGQLESYQYDNGEEVEEWTDVIGLDYSKRELWNYMHHAMEYWIQESDIDGFRCDVVGLVPLQFWIEARRRLEKIKPVFLLAEWDDNKMHKAAFDATYDWKLAKLMMQLAAKKGDKNDLLNYLQKEALTYPNGAIRMKFSTNHDYNSWKGTTQELYGSYEKVTAVLTYILPGLPLMYNGQESGLDKQLSFFEKDQLKFEENEWTDFYSLLNKLKRSDALDCGTEQAELHWIENGNPNLVQIIRSKKGEKILVNLNLSGLTQKLNLPTGDRWINYMSDNDDPGAIDPYGFSIFRSK